MLQETRPLSRRVDLPIKKGPRDICLSCSGQEMFQRRAVGGYRSMQGPGMPGAVALGVGFQ